MGPADLPHELIVPLGQALVLRQPHVGAPANGELLDPFRGHRFLPFESVDTPSLAHSDKSDKAVSPRRAPPSSGG